MTKKRKRRKLKKGFKIFLVIFSITLISIIGYIIIKPNKDNKTISKPNILNKNEDKHYEAFHNSSRRLSNSFISL